MIRWTLIGLYCASLVLFGVLARLPLVGAAAAFLTFSALSFAGIVFLRRLVPTIDSSINLLIFGSILGLLCGRICLVVTGLLIGPSFFAAAVTVGGLTVVAISLEVYRRSNRPAWRTEDSQELAWIVAINSAVLVAMGLVYWGVGRLTPKGYAFVPNFSWDLFNHITCTAELSRQIPPQNPYFVGETLHYYWFYHVWPAALINLSGVTARDAVISTLPPTVFVFVGSLTCLVRCYVPKVLPRFLAIGLGLFAFSYIGVFFFMRMLASQFFASLSRIVNSNYSFLSHSWFRDFLYEPHAVTSLTCLAFLLYLDKVPETEVRWRRALLAGLLLGAVAITDLFVGMIALLWFGAVNLRPFMRASESRGPIVLESLLAALVIMGAFALQLFPARSGALHPGIHPTTKYAPLYLLVEMGPLFVFGAVGLFLALRRDRAAFSPSLLILLSIALVIAFTLIVDIEINQVIRKSIKVVQLPLVVFAAIACSAFLELPARHWLRPIGALVMIAGLSTILSDIFQYVDVEAVRKPATEYISRDKMQALEWIRNHTASDTVVQLLDEVRPGQKIKENFDISIPTIAERRTLFGNYEFLYVTHVHESDIESRKAILEDVFASANAAVLEKNLDRLPPHYILVDGSSPGPLDAVRQLTDSGILEQRFRVGQMSVLVKKQARF